MEMEQDDDVKLLRGAKRQMMIGRRMGQLEELLLRSQRMMLGRQKVVQEQGRCRNAHLHNHHQYRGRCLHYEVLPSEEEAVFLCVAGKSFRI